jgi:hypothetical protein
MKMKIKFIDWENVWMKWLLGFNRLKIESLIREFYATKKLLILRMV